MALLILILSISLISLHNPTQEDTCEMYIVAGPGNSPGNFRFTIRYRGDKP